MQVVCSNSRYQRSKTTTTKETYTSERWGKEGGTTIHQISFTVDIRSKMSKRDYIDAGSIQTTVNFDGHIYHIRIAFRRTDSNSEYNIDIESNGVEVIVE